MAHIHNATKVAPLGSPLNWRPQRGARIPSFFLLTDQNRLPDPLHVLAYLPRGAAVIVRHTDPAKLESLVRQILAPAHRLKLKVLVAGDMRLALKIGADGVHLSEAQARRGPHRRSAPRKNFIFTAAAHSRLAIWRAAQAGAQRVLLSPTYPTRSHVNARALGLFRVLTLAKLSRVPVVALGGVTHKNARRLRAGAVVGVAAIGAWRPARSTTRLSCTRKI